MNKKIIVILITVVFIVFGIFVYLRTADGNYWACINGQWVKYGNPNTPAPTTGCETAKTDNTGTTTDETDIIVTKPQANDEVASPLEIIGQARGSWYFEASFPIRLEDAKGNIFANVPAQAQSDWMTTDFVPFKARLEFIATASGPGKLILAKDNPSGLPEFDKKIEIPVEILAISAENITVKVYFNNNNLDPEITCIKVFPAERIISKTQAIAKAAIEALLKGPTETEKAEGYLTSINPGVKLNSISINKGVAKVDFNETMQQGMGGSCRVSAIRSQIEATLKQFPTVKNVIISVNGRTEDILQP